MTDRILSLFVGLTVLSGCSPDAPDIHTLCLRDAIGNYIIKWEMIPPVDGRVKIYVSRNPDKFNLKAAPAVQADIRRGMAAYITNDNAIRQYFYLTFNDKAGQVTGARLVEMDSVLNLRDMGGYFNPDNRMTRWGMVYRSGDLSCLSTSDSLRLNGLGLKTVIDLRSSQEAELKPLNLEGVNIFRLPLTASTMDGILSFLHDERMRKGDAAVYMQDLYLKFITENSEAFAQALRLFLDKTNYPILFSSALGKDGAGFLASLLLSALSVPDETITDDYLESNNYVTFNRFADIAGSLALSPEIEKALLVLLSADEAFLSPLRQKIKADYDSFPHYLGSALGFSPKSCAKLQDILLY
ncbi:Protein tyrosine/serine phosphatase [Bacteroidales bacterium Barb7]|nr:Protein tyrosine/serine phosphatase [Bacteroidales bacterium Barb7]